MRGTKTPFAVLVVLAAVMLFTGSARAVEKIDIGDYVQISVLNHPEFSRLVRVEQNGTVLYPYLMDVPVAGMSMTELQTLLVQILQKYLDGPIVLVEKPDVYMITVQVLGQVRKPGLVEIPSGLDIQSAIFAAGGFTEYANATRVHLLRPKGKDRKDWQKIEGNITRFLTEGDITVLPVLEENDIIVVPSISNENSVMVIGSVNAPGNYVPVPGTNLLNIILMSGGPRREADLKKVRYLRKIGPGEYEELDLNLDKWINKGKLDEIPFVSGGDVVVVPEYDPLFDMDDIYTLLRDIWMLVAVYVIYLRLQD